MPDDLTLALLIFAAAVLYSSVGHAGASGYLAVMALLNYAPEEMKPTALVLNVLVATIGTVQFVRAGHFSWKFFWPFALGSAPFAYYGGWLTIEGALYKQIVGVILVLSALRMALARRATAEFEARPVGPPVRTVCGAAIGFLAGLTGTGGGIFLSPLVLLAKWADVRRTAATSVVFILINSLAGLAGNLQQVGRLPTNIPFLLMAAGVGGIVGSELGSRRLDTTTIKRVLAVVLVVAGAKLVLT
jgi:uncharacterized membrane protein YfcA